MARRRFIDDGYQAGQGPSLREQLVSAFDRIFELESSAEEDTRAETGPKFKTHAEKDFWEKIYVSYASAGNTLIAHERADAAVLERRVRMTHINRGVKAA